MGVTCALLALITWYFDAVFFFIVELTERQLTQKNRYT